MDMFKNRAVMVTWNKKEKDERDPNSPTTTFEDKADIVWERVEDIAIKMFLGFCIYIYLDTRRQVKVEQARKY